MIKLENIKNNGMVITCDAYVEDSEVSVPLSCSKSTGVAKFKLPEGYEYCDWHISIYAKKELERMLETGEHPEKRVIMWY